MGYRLRVYKVEKKETFFGGKLYGYLGGYENNLESVKFLIDNGYIEDLSDTKVGVYFFNCDGDGDIIMYVKDFKQWIKLYAEEYNKYNTNHKEPVDFMQDKGIQEIFKLDDYDKVMLEWGA